MKKKQKAGLILFTFNTIHIMNTPILKAVIAFAAVFVFANSASAEADTAAAGAAASRYLYCANVAQFYYQYLLKNNPSSPAVATYQATRDNFRLGAAVTHAFPDSASFTAENDVALKKVVEVLEKEKTEHADLMSAENKSCAETMSKEVVPLLKSKNDAPAPAPTPTSSPSPSSNPGTSSVESSDEELGNKYLYCGILVNQVYGGSSQRGNFMLVIGTQLLGNKGLEELKPNINAAKEQVAKDMKSPNISFDKLSDCVKMDNEKGKALFEKYKDALTKNAAE